MHFLPLLLAFTTFILWGTGDIFGTLSSRKIGAMTTTYWVSILGIFIFAPLAYFHKDELLNISFPIFISIILVGALDVIGNYAFNKASSLGKASLNGTLAGSFAAITTLLSVIFLHESLTKYQALAIILIFAGIIFATLKFSELKNSEFLHDKGIKWALVSMICWGIFFTLIKLLIIKVGWFWPIYIPFFLFPIYHLSTMNKVKTKIELRWSLLFIAILLSALMLRSGDMLYNISLSQSQSSLTAPIAGSYPILYSVLAFYVFKEKLSKQQIFGISCTLLGIIALSFFSV
jgi:drug/metabolite transporter (DMT)-like permease